MVNCDETSGAEFDADIAGLGVLIAFLATSLVAIFTLVAAFVTLSVPSRLLNTGDAVMVSAIRGFYHRKRGKASEPEPDNTRNERINAYKAFLHSTSDQVLVSQVAILIAATIIHAEITIYSANIVIALGCLASTVHLGCFPFYVDRLRNHDIAKLLRVVTMAAGSAILVFMLIIQLSNTWDMEGKVYLTCVLRDYSVSLEDILSSIVELLVPITVLYGTYEVIQLLYQKIDQDDEELSGKLKGLSKSSRAAENSNSQQRAPGQDIEVQTVRIEVPRRLDEVHSAELSKVEQEALTIYQILQAVHGNGINPTADGENNYRQLRSKLFQHHSKKMSIRDVLHQTREDRRAKLLNRWLQLQALNLLTAKPKLRMSLRARLLLTAERWAYHQCRGSFVWRVLWLWSGNVYGIASVFVSRLTTTTLEGDPDHWGFGQVVPLALLALPIFTAMEGHADYRRQVGPNVGNHQEPTSGTGRRVTSTGYNPIASHHPTEDGMSGDDVEAVRFVKKLLKSQAKRMGHPYLYDWMRGVALEDVRTLQAAAGAQALFMSIITTLLGLSMALGFSLGNLILDVILAVMFFRRAVGLVLIANSVRNLPLILETLGSDIANASVQVGDHAEHMMVAQAAGEMEQDVEDNR